jgi:Cu+-exporting ATPase
MRLLSADGFYAKHSKVLETLSVCDTIVLDKTGTLTINQPRIQSFVGKPLSNEEIILISTATKQSIHPLSRAIYNEFADAAIGEVQAFEEIAGKGIQASINQKEILLGSASFIFNTDSGNETNGQTQVHLNIDGDYKGYFILEQHLRPAIPFLLPALKHKYHIYILSGDKLNTAAAFENFIHPDHIYLNQTPESKLNFIKDLQAKHHKVIMVGDGLNDAGSLKQADVGIAMTDDLLQFTPGSDIIMNAATLSRFNKILEYVRFGRKLIYGIFTYSLLYNIIGMFFAVQGQLSPLIAAILMPISSLSVIGISYVGSWMKAYWSVRS